METQVLVFIVIVVLSVSALVLYLFVLKGVRIQGTKLVSLLEGIFTQ